MFEELSPCNLLKNCLDKALIGENPGMLSNRIFNTA